MIGKSLFILLLTCTCHFFKKINPSKPTCLETASDVECFSYGDNSARNQAETCPKKCIPKVVEKNKGLSTHLMQQEDHL